LKAQLRCVFLALVAVACARDLSGPGADVQLQFSISKVADSAAVGSITIRTAELLITASDDGEYDWSIATRGGEWLAVSDSAGTTPSNVSVFLDPAGLPIGIHEDTLLVVLAGSDVPPFAVPAVFRVHACRELQSTVGTVALDSITGSDCEAPGRVSSFADVYEFQGMQGDSVSIVMLSNAIDAYVILDSLPDAGSPPLFESDGCPDTSGNACIIDYQLPYTGHYFVQATTAGAGQLGSYSLEVSRPRIPNLPETVRQLQFDSASVLAIGSATQTSSAVLSAVVSDQDAYNALRLQIEVRPVTTPFADDATGESDLLQHGDTGYVGIAGLVEGTGYHWQARVIDNTGRSSGWLSFGGNGEGDADFTGPPAAGPTHLQFTTQPSTTGAGDLLVPAVQVSVLDASGGLVTDYDAPVDLQIATGTGAPGAELGGTTSIAPAGGVATFDDLTIDLSGIGYRLTASSADLSPVSSNVFDIQGDTPDFVLFAQGFSSPVLVTAPPGDSNRVFVVEQTGRIRIVRDGSTLATPFLDLSNEISNGGERGLLGLAFDPDYESNGAFFVNHTGSDGNTRLVRYGVSGNPDVADPTTADTLLSVSQPFSNHNGGHLSFGPGNMLYIGLGDGGSGGDPQGHGQDLSTLLGNILRIDVSGPTGYDIPADNPYANSPSARPEIWISGVRNPWRFSFDRETGDLYVGDVGQGSWEEITVQPGTSNGGENFGWNVMEGAHCFNPSSGCDQSGLTLPNVEYSHDEGCSVTGGYVYRGGRVPSLVGYYFYSDYCSGWIRSFRLVAGSVTDNTEWTVPFAGNVTSFGQDAEGNLYIVLQDGRIFRIE
jgi:hypothetical protein